MFIPNEYQYEATVMINQMNQNLPRTPLPSYEPPTLAPSHIDSDYSASRRRSTNSSVRRAAAPPAAGPLMTRSRRRQNAKANEEDTPPIPDDDSRFFEQIRRSIPSDEVYTQFIKLLDLYNRDILPLSELFAAVTDLLHIRHPAVSHLRNYLAQKGINEDEVPRTLVSFLDDLPHHASFLGADPRLQRTHSLLPRTASAGAATSGIAAILRGQPGAERRPGFPDDRVGGLVVHRACWISD